MDRHEIKSRDMIFDNFPVFTDADVAYVLGTDAVCLIFSGKGVVAHKMVFNNRDEFQSFINFLVQARDCTWGDLLKEGE